MAVFLIGGLVTANFLFLEKRTSAEGLGILGGPAPLRAEMAEAGAFLSYPLVLSAAATDHSEMEAAYREGALQGSSGVNLENLAKVPQPKGTSGNLPLLKGYFIRPADGLNWGKLHNWNAVDIANSCGSPIVASAEGLVSDVSLDAWSFGYGRFIVIDHPNGTQTKYAHLDKVLMGIGDYVKQNVKIGTMGQTGEATGCHLHFEIYGAQNPFAK